MLYSPTKRLGFSVPVFDPMTAQRFEEITAEAAAAITDDGLHSVYTGIIQVDGRHEYYFANDTEEAAELREAAAVQLGMLMLVLADRSASNLEEIADLAIQRAEHMELR